MFDSAYRLSALPMCFAVAVIALSDAAEAGPITTATARCIGEQTSETGSSSVATNCASGALGNRLSSASASAFAQGGSLGADAVAATEIIQDDSTIRGSNVADSVAGARFTETFTITAPGVSGFSSAVLELGLAVTASLLLDINGGDEFFAVPFVAVGAGVRALSENNAGAQYSNSISGPAINTDRETTELGEAESLVNIPLVSRPIFNGPGSVTWSPTIEFSISASADCGFLNSAASPVGTSCDARALASNTLNIGNAALFIDGQLIEDAIITADSGFDYTQDVFSTEIPEPATLPILVTGLAGFAASTRSRRLRMTK